MPYRRNYRRRRGPVQKRVHVYGRAGKQLYKDVMYLKTLVNSELHYDYSSYNTTVDSTGSVYHLSAIAQGDTNAQRSGNTVLPRYLQLQVMLYQNAADFDTIRMMVFRWKDNSTPTIANVVEDSSNPIYSPLNDNISGNQRDRQIDVIKNKVFLVGPDASNNGAILYKKTIDLNPPNKQVKDHIKFDDTSTTAPVGGIYMILIGTQAVNTCEFRGMHKLSFHDN